MMAAGSHKPSSILGRTHAGPENRCR